MRARNLLKPVVAAPRPSAAARASTSSLEAISPIEAELGIREAAAGAGWTVVATTGAIEGCVIPGPCLLKSSSMLC